jgi:hypothetical protein
MIAEEKMNRPIRVAFIIGACKLVRNMPRRIDGTPFAHKRKRKTHSSTLSRSLFLVPPWRYRITSPYVRRCQGFVIQTNATSVKMDRKRVWRGLSLRIPLGIKRYIWLFFLFFSDWHYHLEPDKMYVNNQCIERYWIV